jgi:hypothetical protein
LVATLQSQVDLLKGETDEYKKHGFVPNETLLAEINTLREQLEYSDEKIKILSEEKELLETRVEKDNQTLKHLKGALSDKEAELEFLDKEMKVLERNAKAAQGTEEILGECVENQFDSLENKLREAKKDLFVLEERMKKSSSGVPSQYVEKLEQMLNFFQNATRMTVESATPESVDGIQMTAFSCVFKGISSSKSRLNIHPALSFTLSIPDKGIDASHRCIYTPSQCTQSDGADYPLSMLPEYLKDSVEFICLEKFFERLHHWGTSRESCPVPCQPTEA